MAFVGLIGCGNLGSAMLSRWLENGIDPALLKIVDNHPERIEVFNLKPCTLQELSGLDVLVLAVKPWNLEQVFKEIVIDPDTIIVSMAAGVSINKLTKILNRPAPQPICRVMPNIGVKLGMGVLAIAFNELVDTTRKKSIKEILEPLGKTIELKEKDFNAVTALAGSGPAFCSLILESFVNGGIASGLPYQTAKQLAFEIFNVSIALLQNNSDFAELRFQVTSPGGTSAAGLKVLESAGVRGAIMQSIEAASKRAAQLGSETDETA